MLYQALMFFFIYGFFGWCLEVGYHAVKLGTWENRGFLNGAICPIYGVGVVAIHELLQPVSDFWLLIFIGGVALCSLVELVTGFALEKIFHQRWWDYSTEPLNFKGYICLKFSLYWGVAVLIVVKLIHPGVESFVQWIPIHVGIVFLTIAGITLTIDAVDTFRSVIGINRELESVHEAAAVIRKMSDGLSEKIYDRSMRAVEERNELNQKLQQSRDELDLQTALGKAEFESRAEELKVLADEMYSHLKRGQRRMLKAFPNMRSTLYIKGNSEEIKNNESRSAFLNETLNGVLDGVKELAKKLER